MNQQRQLYQDFQLPPNKASIKVTGKVPTAQEVKSQFLQAGLTAADITPIDWRKKVRLTPVKNQMNCGDCWAISTTTALADRFIIQKDIENLLLECAITTQCVPLTLNAGCNGGQPYEAGKFFEATGCAAVTAGCPPWAKLCNSDGCTLPSCSQIDELCKSTTVYKAAPGSTKNLAASSSDGKFDVNITIENIKKELLNGPVVAAFFVPRDFMASAIYGWDATNKIYINGAYGADLDKITSEKMDKLKKALGNPQGDGWGELIMEGGNPAGHAVTIVGWDKGNAGGNMGMFLIGL